MSQLNAPYAATIRIFAFCYSVCVLHDSDIQKLSPNLHRLNVFIMETHRVTCEVRNEFLYMTSMSARLQDVKSGCLGSIRKSGDTNMRILHLQCLSPEVSPSINCPQFVRYEMTFTAIIRSTVNSLHNLSRKTISARP
jgi:hypothetical protein